MMMLEDPRNFCRIVESIIEADAKGYAAAQQILQ
jgi:hypothetical protein